MSNGQWLGKSVPYVVHIRNTREATTPMRPTYKYKNAEIHILYATVPGAGAGTVIVVVAVVALPLLLISSNYKRK